MHVTEGIRFLISLKVHRLFLPTAMVRILYIFLCLFLLNVVDVCAQPQSFVHEGEIGITFGGAHYFGDLNSRTALNRPKPSVGFFMRKQIGNYVAVRLAANYAQLGYSDQYSNIQFNRRRNLSFNTQLFEIGLQGDFNFFRFEPWSDEFFFTPYVTLGAGIFNFNPYAYLNGEKHYLRPLGTEGQGSTLYPGRKFYKNMAFSFPIGMGVKYNLTRNINLMLEATHRFTTTDYLDDVSMTYAGQGVFPPQPNGTPSVAFQLQDRSGQTGVPIGFAGRQRGFSAQRDQYIFIQAGFSFSLSSYRCPE
jgi:hypothetical protein